MAFLLSEDRQQTSPAESPDRERPPVHHVRAGQGAHVELEARMPEQVSSVPAEAAHLHPVEQPRRRGPGQSSWVVILVFWWNRGLYFSLLVCKYFELIFTCLRNLG